MAEIVNLRRVRKARARADEAANAAENRAIHGQTRAEKAGAQQDGLRAQRTLDLARLDSATEE